MGEGKVPFLAYGVRNWKVQRDYTNHVGYGNEEKRKIEGDKRRALLFCVFPMLTILYISYHG